MALVDVLAYERPNGATSYRAVAAGRADEIVAAHEVEYRKRRVLRWLLGGFVALAVVAYSLLVVQRPLLGAVVAGAVVGLVGRSAPSKDETVPSVVAERIDRQEANDRYELDVIPS